MTEPRHLLVVDDEKDLVDLLTYNLRKAGYQVSSATTGLRALQAVTERRPDLILLDVMLPELTGTEVAARLRANPETSTIPIIMLTAKGGEADQLVGLSVGADDYVVKPFSPRVLLARVEAVLRRTSRPPDQREELALGPITINLETREAFLDAEPLKLTLTEFRLLSSLLAANGRVLSRQVLMSNAMGPGVTERTIDVHITAIRKKLGPYAGIIKTSRGTGYRATLDQPGEGESH
jgi:DNA-binding response OmpR family regulator